MLSDTIVGALIGASATIIIGGVAIFFGRKRKKIITYDVSSMALLRFSPRSTPIFTVSVDKFTLTGAPEDAGKREEINDAYGFEIRLQNRGKEDIISISGKQPIIKVRLDRAAKIVHWETDPRSENVYNISVEKGEQPDTIFISPPYLNSKQQIQVRVISTDNRTRECHVEAYGEGLKAQPLSQTRRLFILGVLMLTSLGANIFILIMNPQLLVINIPLPEFLIQLISIVLFGGCVGLLTAIIAGKLMRFRSGSSDWGNRKPKR